MKIFLHPFDAFLFACAFLTAAFCIYLFNAENIFLAEDPSSQVGTVIDVENDLRAKSAKRWGWQPLSKNSNISDGDALFTGDGSKAEIKFKDGSRFTLNENSLIKFSTLNGALVPNLKMGSIKLKVEGSTKIQINGKTKTISGKNSMVEITLSEDKPAQIQVVEGAVKVSSAKIPEELSDTSTDTEKEFEEINLSVQETAVLPDVAQASKIENYDQIVNEAPVSNVTKQIASDDNPMLTEIEAPQVATPEKLKAPAQVETSTKTFIAKEKIEPKLKQSSELQEPTAPSTPTSSLNVETAALPPVVTEEVPLRSTPIQIFGGFGFTYHDIQQDFSDIDVNYNSFTLPSLSIGFKKDLENERQVRFEISRLNILFDNKSVSASSQNASWSVFQYESRQPLDFKKAFFDPKDLSESWAWTYDLQIQEIPLSMFKTSDLSPTLRAYRSLNVGLGFEYVVQQNDDVLFSLQQRLQFPVVSQSSQRSDRFSLSNSVIYDGSLWYEKMQPNQSWLGLKWKGQYQMHNLQYADDNVNSSGKQQLFFSTFEFTIRKKL